MGHSLSQPRLLDPHLYAGYLKSDLEKRRTADTGTPWPPCSLVAPPPYTSVVTKEINGMRHTSPPSSATTSSGTSPSMTLPPGSRRTHVFMMHPAFSSSERLLDVAYLQAPMRRESKESALATLRAYDTVVIMDDSASMLQDRHRWERACKALSELAQTSATYGKDGIDIHFLNHPKYGINIKDAKSVRRLFRHVRPQGLTPIANKLEVLVGDYLERLEATTLWKRKGQPSTLKRPKPVNFIVITDGAPTDEPIDCIVSLARRLDRGNYPLGQVGIQFVQIGDDDGAAEFLKRLDDDLSGNYGVRDMVDAIPFVGIEPTAEMLIKVLLDGIYRRVGVPAAKQ